MTIRGKRLCLNGDGSECNIDKGCVSIIVNLIRFRIQSTSAMYLMRNITHSYRYSLFLRLLLKNKILQHRTVSLLSLLNSKGYEERFEGITQLVTSRWVKKRCSFS